MKDFLGIIGGMGSEASAYFYNQLIRKTKVEKDQDHIDAVIFNHASLPDRTDFILGKIEDSPLPLLKEDVRKISELGAKKILITCNTAHYFYEDLQKETNVEILHLMRDTVNYLKKENIKKVGILGTTATIKLKLYQKELNEKGIMYETPSEKNQEKVMQIIYDQIKAGKSVDEKKFYQIIEELQRTNVDAIIMGCTELSILKTDLKLPNEYIDPLDIQIANIQKIYKKVSK